MGLPKGNTMPIRLTVNGQELSLDLPGETLLLEVLRNDLRLNGPKYGCGLAECGACTVLVDGRAARPCVMTLAAVADKSVTTLEGLARDGRMHPVQRAFVDRQAAQCGYCLNGMILQTVALLAAQPAPDRDTIRRALRHNLCRCGTHLEILQAVEHAVALIAEDAR